MADGSSLGGGGKMRKTYKVIYGRYDDYGLPKCSNCYACPTYDEQFCPFCGVELDYSGEEKEEGEE